MYIAKVPNRNSPPAYLLREGYREGNKVKTRTLANLTSLGPDKIEQIRRVLRGETLAPVQDKFEIRRALPHGHVAAVLGLMKKLGLDQLIDRQASRQRKLCLAMIVARLIDPVSKRATARALDLATATSSLAAVLELGSVTEDELYAALDWLVQRQERIENRLAKRHLEDGALVLYDLTSTWLEGRHCDLAAYGHSRDGKKGKLQIVFGLLCNAAGCPVAVEVFAGNTGDPTTLEAQLAKVRARFGLSRVVWVGDRGMITSARIDDDLRPHGFDWITALRAPAIRTLAAADGPLQLSLFDDRDLAEIRSADYPGERLVVCRNGALSVERARKREALLAVTEARLAAIQQRVDRQRRPLRGAAEIGQAVGKVLGASKVAKHFEVTITDDSFKVARKQAAIEAEAALDGVYVLRTSVPAETMEPAAVVSAYKDLSWVEQAFRSLKTVDLQVRPVFHRRDRRVRAHVFLCMLAYYLEWHLRQALAPLLFDDHERAVAQAERPSPVAKARRSEAAKAKAASGRTPDGLPVHSFQSLLGDLATLTRNTVATADGSDVTFTAYANPTALQQRVFELLGVKQII